MTPPLSRRTTPSLVLLALYLLTLPVYGLLRLTNQSEALSTMTVIIIVLFFCASMAHLLETRGLQRAALMAGSAFIISLGAEMFGVGTGLLFGNYTYSEQLGPRILGLVPLVIPVAWMMMLYPSYAIAKFLTRSSRNPISGDASRDLSRSEIGFLATLTTKVVTTGIAALAMTAWDLSLDPRMVRDGNWVWHGGGPYFGIPISNFVGWFITACVIFILWQVIDSKPFGHAMRKETRFLVTQAAINRRQKSGFYLAHLPIYAYIIQWVAESMASIVFWGNPLVGVAVFIGMGIFSVPALLRLRAMRVSSAQQND